MRTDHLLSGGLLQANIPRQTILLPRRNSTPVPPGVVVPTDGPDGWYVPETAEHFTALGLAPPDYLWLCQEASGNLSSAIGSLTLTANATNHLYEQTVTGWTRKFVGLDGATNAQSWRTTDAALDLAAGESFAVLAYVSVTVPGNNRTLFAAQGANNLAGITATTGTPRGTFNNVAATGAQALGPITTVNQIVWYRNGTTNVSEIVTNLETVAGTHSENALTAQVRSIGPNGATAPPAARFGLFGIWKGANAERDWAAYMAVLRG